MENTKKEHWETVFTTKAENEVSWYQNEPKTSIQLIQACKVAKDTKIIDIGGGDSFFVDHLLDLGFENISVLDISQSAIDRAKERLGVKAEKVNWLVVDIVDFQALEQYDFWHDRAAFHFLTSENEVKNYIETAAKSISSNGILAIGTFSEQGPTKCSGIEIKQYSESSLSNLFLNDFDKIECFKVDHSTPFDTIQNFVFCSFRKK